MYDTVIIFRKYNIIKGLSHAVEFTLTDKKASESKAIFKIFNIGKQADE